MRDKVYQKARATVSAKLDAINPPPPAAVRDRQMKALEDAIATIETGYRDRPQKPASPLDELEEVFASLSGLKARDQAAPAVVRPAPANGAARVSPPPPLPEPVMPEPERVPQAETPVAAGTIQQEPMASVGEPEDEEHFAESVRERSRRGYGGAIAALIALAVVGAGCYGLWLNKDDLASMWSSGSQSEQPQAAAPPAVEDVPSEQAAAPEGEASTPSPEAEAEAEATTDVAAATPGEAAADAPVKFNQRLNSDGTETDMGVPDAAPTIGEGTSVAQATQSSEPLGPPASTVPDVAPADPALPPAETGTEATAPTTPDAAADTPPSDAALPVGQKAIFYEERTNTSQGSAEPGTIVWSLVQESPGGDLPPEPAIQAQATIPGKDLQLRITIRRNGDRTLPASHIVEMIFITPEGFEGGGIDNVLRVAMKNSEQEAGNPLLGIPAKIADNYFLIALNDAKPEVEANLSLLRRQSWIDVPLVYKSGRRALFTMEKGIPGEKVFEEALKAWQTDGNG